MSGIGEASLVLGIISSVISIIEATKNAYEAVQDEKGLPTNFKKSAQKLPLIAKLLEDAERYINNTTDESTRSAFTPTLEDCKAQATDLQELFDKVMPEEGDSRWDRYVKAARTIGKKGRVEGLVGGILEDLQLLTTRFPDVTTDRGKDQLAKAIEEVAQMEPSLPDGFEQAPVYAHYGSGAQNNNVGGTQYNNNSTGNQNNGPGQQYIGTNHIAQYTIKNVTIDEIDQSCLRSLQCPDAFGVQNHILENNDKLRRECVDWIFHHEKYLRWKDGDNVGLFWIKGGAGKGKTMMSIGLIERLSSQQHNDTSTAVTYFFCQNADHNLNTLESIIKGLILQLVNQRKELKEYLRRHWDTNNESFTVDVTQWQTIWGIFREMLEKCECQRVYVVVDALDECQNDGMAAFLKSLVRTGLKTPSKVKWLVTSRPLDTADKLLLADDDQLQVNLELNFAQISEAVKTYITFKVSEIAQLHRWEETLRQEIEIHLTEKAKGSYMWVSLVCKELEKVHPAKALATIQDLPPGLYPFYRRIFNQLSSCEPVVAKGCMRLLQVMILAYRPLKMAEVCSIASPFDEGVALEVLVDRIASFVKMRGAYIEFVHQSVRDYLAKENGLSKLDSHERYGHREIALACLSHLSERLKPNLLDLQQPDATPRYSTLTRYKGKNPLSNSLEYAATFWVQHLRDAQSTAIMQSGVTEKGAVGTFLRTKFLEWLEYLSLLDKLPEASRALKVLRGLLNDNDLLLTHVEDAKQFLKRHRYTISDWPLQIYSSAVIFSPDTSVTRRENLHKVPGWLRQIPLMGYYWGSSIWTLSYHDDVVTAVVVSPDGKHMASSSRDKTIKLWNTSTGNLQKTLVGHSDWVTTVVFSPDGKKIASSSSDNTVKLWDVSTGGLLKTLKGHYSFAMNVAFSPEGKHIAFGSYDNTVMVWDVTTYDLRKTLAGHNGYVTTVAFSPDGRYIASGSLDQKIKIWDTTTGALQKTLEGHEDCLTAVTFSSDGRQIASSSYDSTIKVWDVAEALKASKYLGHNLNRLWKFRSWQEVKISNTINTIKFTADNHYLKTDIGLIKTESPLSNRPETALEPTQDIHVRNYWLCFGDMALVRLPTDSAQICDDVRGDQLAIGYNNGRVLMFNIDRRRLQSIMKDSSSRTTSLIYGTATEP